MTTTYLQPLLGLTATSKVSQKQRVVQAERREEQIIIGIGLVHGVEEVGGEDREAFVEIPRLVLELCVLLDVVGEAELSAGVGQGREPDKRHEQAAENPHHVHLKEVSG